MPRMNQLGKTATSIYTENGVTRVIYHHTCVVAFDAKSMTLNHGGWRTATTRNRMNQAAHQFELPYQVFQRNYKWYINFDGKEIEFDAVTPITLKRIL